MNIVKSALLFLTVPGFLLLLFSQVYSQPATGQVNVPNESVEAEDASADYAVEKGMNEFGFWGGGSFDSPTVIGSAEDTKYLALGLRYGRVLGGTKHVALQYTADVVPLAVVFRSDFAGVFGPNADKPVYGAGISPIGFRALFNRKGRVKPFADTSGGFLYFNRPVPYDAQDATKFNFTFHFGGGIQIHTKRRRAITIGYKFQHISNAGRSDFNPGLDANVFYVGYSFFK